MSNSKVEKISEKPHLFQKGRPKTGGRKKGTPNKSSLGVKDLLTARGIEPIVELLEIAENTEDDQVKVNVYKEICKYCYPQLKAVEMSAGNNDNVTISINRKAVEVERD